AVPIAAAAQESDTPEPATEALRPGDVIRVQIWREETLSGDFPVSPDGVVVLPKIGRYDVTQDPPETLRRRFIEDFRRYLRNPSIEITFLRRITILGAVREAGLQLVDPTMTVADALALAGGTTPDGKTNSIHVIRNGERIQTVNDQMRITETPLRSGDQLFVPERSWPSRNPGIVAAVISGVVSIAIALLAR
ncbi:MAG: polysaccharide biosynthesis/export family protein, partial [Longimicrobiales bacterium]